MTVIFSFIKTSMCEKFKDLFLCSRWRPGSYWWHTQQPQRIHFHQSWMKSFTHTGDTNENKCWSSRPWKNTLTKLDWIRTRINLKTKQKIQIAPAAFSQTRIWQHTWRYTSTIRLIWKKQSVDLNQKQLLHRCKLGHQKIKNPRSFASISVRQQRQ